MSPEKRSPAFLAALASVAVPGLDPVSARAIRPGRSDEFDAAIIIDVEGRSWFVRCPRTPTAGARLEAAATLVTLLARRLPFQVPVPQGFAVVPSGKAAVYPLLPGRPLAINSLPGGPGVAAELGRSIAAIHNLDRAIYDEAGVPTYDAATYRARRLAELDRAAATGHVPAPLLTRWESALDDVSLWRFAPAPVHGGLTGSQVLAVLDADAGATQGCIRAVLGWEDARVADPAEDFAALVSQATPGAVESVLESYANARTAPPDPHLRRRALLASELGLMSDLLEATTLGDPDRVVAMAERLRALGRHVGDDDLKAPPPTRLVPRDVPRDESEPLAGRPPAPAGPPAPGRSPDLPDAVGPALPAPGVGAAPTGQEPGEDTVGMDPRTIFDATEEIPSAQLAAVRRSSAAAVTDEIPAGGQDAPSGGQEPNMLDTSGDSASAGSDNDVI